MSQRVGEIMAILEAVREPDDKAAIELARDVVRSMDEQGARFERMHAEHMALVEHMTDKMLAMFDIHVRNADATIRDGTETPHLGRVRPVSHATGAKVEGLGSVDDDEEAEHVKLSEVLASTNPGVVASDRIGPVPKK